MKKIFKIYLISIFLSVCNNLFAQDINNQTVIVDKKVLSESTIRLNSITNNSGYDIEVNITTPVGTKTVKILKGNKTVINIGCTRFQIQPYGTSQSVGSILWTKKQTKALWDKNHPTPKDNKDVAAKEDDKSSEEKKETEALSVNKDNSKFVKDKKRNKSISSDEIVKLFNEEIEHDSILSDASINNIIEETSDHIKCLKHWKDKNQYIQENKLYEYVKTKQQENLDYYNKCNDFCNSFLEKYKNYNIESNFSCEDSLIRIIESKLAKRKQAIEILESTIDEDKSSEYSIFNKISSSTIINISIIVLIIVLLIIWFVKKSKNKSVLKNNIITPPVNKTTEEAGQSIVIRRKTTSILKKQNIDDVIDNKSYFKISCNDFCGDTTVKNIYIKNTCIKDIYNMYAEDLRNPSNPKEDGCMVLGRWVQNEHTKDYDVSLEEIVQPGDDAVFQEYELNFGGKIKLKVAEKLRKLRRETDLQYDLTCWVHSHPGLGVFFSNSDSSVQMQLKHPSHPYFLTAIVVDILTPNQEFGIFTFKHDGSINSKNDIYKMYSLEELHKWAVESDRNSFKSEDHYNSLSKAALFDPGCQGVQLSNGAIIDICSITTELHNGLVGWTSGFYSNNKGKNEFVIDGISKTDKSTENDLFGCLVVGSHCSIPSIRKAIADLTNKVKFILFYSTIDETITTIPVVDKQICMDEKYYGNEKLEDLKIWTRRRR